MKTMNVQGSYGLFAVAAPGQGRPSESMSVGQHGAQGFEAPGVAQADGARRGLERSEELPVQSQFGMDCGLGEF